MRVYDGKCVMQREDLVELKKILDRSLVFIRWYAKDGMLTQREVNRIIKRVKLQGRLDAAIGCSTSVE